MPSKAILWLKTLVHVLCLLPVLHLLQMYVSGALANQDDPTHFLTHFTGHWALWLLLVSLAITPVRRISPKVAWLIRFRRMLGLYAFAYATLHLSMYVFLFSGYDVAAATAGLKAHQWAEPWRQLQIIWPSIMDDVRTKRFIVAGLIAWLILLALAITSPQRVLLAMGGKNWQRLHRFVYLAAWIAITHFWWQMKRGATTPAKVTLILVVLLLARLAFWIIKKLKAKRRPALVTTA